MKDFKKWVSLEAHTAKFYQKLTKECEIPVLINTSQWSKLIDKTNKLIAESKENYGGNAYDLCPRILGYLIFMRKKAQKAKNYWFIYKIFNKKKLTLIKELLYSWEETQRLAGKYLGRSFIC